MSQREVVRRPLIGLGGYAQSGKDTAAQTLLAAGWTRFAFADTLKEFLVIVNPMIETGDRQCVRLARLIETVGWDHAKSTYPEVRRLLQDTGTNAARALLGNHVWIDALWRKVDILVPRLPVVITDVRMPNEADAVRDHGGLLVRITRPGVGPLNGHSSESGIDAIDWDEELVNDSSPQALGEQMLRVAWAAEFMGQDTTLVGVAG